MAATRAAMKYDNRRSAAGNVTEDFIISEAFNPFIPRDLERDSAFHRGGLRHGLESEERSKTDRGEISRPAICHVTEDENLGYSAGKRTEINICR